MPIYRLHSDFMKVNFHKSSFDAIIDSMRHYLGIFLAVLLLGVPWFATVYPDQFIATLSAVTSFNDQFAAVILTHNAKTVADIQSKYNAVTNTVSAKKVRILIVPGHEPTYGGAEYGSIKERDLTVELGKDLKQLLDNNGHYQVYITRDTNAWEQNFDSYFKTNWDNIISWVKINRQEMTHLISVGSVKHVTPTIIHNKAPQNVAYRLFGITKWANENDIDITIHIHFNDYSGHGRNPGEYSGFTIYVPEGQYSNSTTTKAIAKDVFNRLEKYNPVSDLPGESTGIVEEPDLIAVGVNNTSDAASMLIEYGYIYEQQFTNSTLRSSALRDLAFQTYLGLQDFFGSPSVLNSSMSFDTLLIPHDWRQSITNKTASSSLDIYALQTAMVIDGVYPPGDKNLNDCPRTGSLGPCTLTALDAFQNKYGITDEKGVVGPKTRTILNGRFGVGGVM